MACETGRGDVPLRSGQGNRLVLGLARGGIIGSQVCMLVAVALSFLLWGPSAAANAAIASAVTLVFFASGQAVEVVATELANATGLLLTMASYAVRAGALGLLLWLAMTGGAADDIVHPSGLLLGALLATLGWVGGVVFVGRRQRVLVHDTEYRPPEEWDE